MRPECVHYSGTTIALKKSLTAFSPKHACPSRRAKCEAESPMTLEAILAEAEQLHNGSNRLKALAEQHPPVSDALLTISGNVRNTATVLEVLIVTKMTKPI